MKMPPPTSHPFARTVAAPARPPGLDNIPGPRPISGREHARSALTSHAVSPTPGPNSRTQSVQFHTPPPQLDSEDEDDGLRDEDKLDERCDPTPPPVIIRDNFTYPTEEAFLRRPPRLKNLNPHRKNATYDLPLADARNQPVRVTFQHDQGKFPRPVIDGDLAVAGIPDDFVETLCNSPDSIALIVPFLGGRHLVESWGHPNLITAITNVLADSGVADRDNFKVIPITPDKPGRAGDLYSPPFVLAIRLTIPGLIDYLTAIATFIRDCDLAFHIIEYNPHLRTWTVALFTASFGEGSTENAGYLRWSMACHVLDAPAVRTAFERATGGADQHPINVRLLEFTRTIDVRYNPHSKHWCVYARPCTDNFDDWEAVRATMRFVPLRHATGFVTFSPVATFAKQAPWCLLCKDDHHLYYGCYFARDDPDSYWGPFEQISWITEGILAKRKGPQGGGSGSGSNGGGGGAPRGGNNGGSNGRGVCNGGKAPQRSGGDPSHNRYAVPPGRR
ncbi:hypothetical protein FB451DRAFT_1164276 [Mycena latifolia]|nr:hypothetical protein FB451DRAFT_1164276 [Mycena latifolia]